MRRNKQFPPFKKKKKMTKGNCNNLKVVTVRSPNNFKNMFKKKEWPTPLLKTISQHWFYEKTQNEFSSSSLLQTFQQQCICNPANT